MNIIKAISLLWTLNGEVRKLKTGFLTTEFWITIINIVGMILGAFMDKIPVPTALLVGAILSGLYIIARTIVKATTSTFDDELLEKIKGLIIDKFPKEG